LLCDYILKPVLLSPHRIPPSIALKIPKPQPVAFAVRLATLTGMAGRCAIIGALGFGAYISRLCSGVSPVSVGVGSVLTLTFWAARIARVLFGLGISKLPTSITRKRGDIIKPTSTACRLCLYSVALASVYPVATIATHGPDCHAVASLFVCSTYCGYLSYNAGK
jgi:hypothetical protein